MTELIAYIASCCLLIFYGGKEIINISSDVKQADEFESVVEIDFAKRDAKFADIKNIISVADATSVLREKLNRNYDNVHLICEKIEFHGIDNSERRSFYIFRAYNDFPDHRATFGWYAVDVENGDCFDTHVLTEWSSL